MWIELHKAGTIWLMSFGAIWALSGAKYLPVFSYAKLQVQIYHLKELTYAKVWISDHHHGRTPHDVRHSYGSQPRR